MIVSPFIGELAEERFKLSDVLNKALREKTRVYVITRSPSEEYHRISLEILDSYPNVEIRLNSEIHAKLFVCWCRDEVESFALLGLATLPSGGFRSNLELGMMIYRVDMEERSFKIYITGVVMIFELKVNVSNRFIQALRRTP